MKTGITLMGPYGNEITLDIEGEDGVMVKDLKLAILNYLRTGNKNSALRELCEITYAKHLDDLVDDLEVTSW